MFFFNLGHTVDSPPPFLDFWFCHCIQWANKKNKVYIHHIGGWPRKATVDLKTREPMHLWGSSGEEYFCLIIMSYFPHFMLKIWLFFFFSPALFFKVKKIDISELFCTSNFSCYTVLWIHKVLHFVLKLFVQGRELIWMLSGIHDQLWLSKVISTTLQNFSTLTL